MSSLGATLVLKWSTTLYLTIKNISLFTQKFDANNSINLKLYFTLLITNVIFNVILITEQ